MTKILQLNKFLAICYCIFFSASAFAQDDHWGNHADTDWYTGDKKTYTLKTAAELAGFAKLINDKTAHFGTDTIKIGEDMDLSDYQWVPVGINATAFKGCFDGQGYAIKGLKINPHKEGCGYSTDTIGFFLRIEANDKDSIVIKNVVLSREKDAEIVGGVAGESFCSTGALIGNAEAKSEGKITIEGCRNEIPVTGGVVLLEDSYRRFATGGLLGRVASEKENGITLRSCDNRGIITGGGVDSDAFAITGGLVGVGRNLNLINCTNRGNVTSRSNDANIGGLIGEAIFINAISCTNEGDVSAAAGVTPTTGGLFGFANTISINGCKNVGNVTGGGGSMNGTGGLIGRGAIDENEDVLKVFNCHNGGNVTTNTQAGLLGGLIGFFGGYASGVVMTIDCSSNSGNITGGAHRGGGLVGLINGSDGKITEIANCYNSGNIESSSAGGLIGDGFNIVLSNSYNSGHVVGELAAGGLIGSGSDNDIRNCFVATATIEGEKDTHRLIGTSSNDQLQGNYASIGNLQVKGNRLDGADWTGLMTFAPVNQWDPAIWIIDSTSYYLPKLNVNNPDILNPKYEALNDVNPGLVKIRYDYLNQETYLEVSENVRDSTLCIGTNVSTAKLFRLDTISAGRFLMALDYEEKESYVKGRFLFNDTNPEEEGIQLYNANYHLSGGHGTCSALLTHAIRIKDTLYMTSDMPAGGLTQLEQNKSIQRISLNKVNNFTFFFLTPDAPNGFYSENAISIESEIGGIAMVEAGTHIRVKFRNRMNVGDLSLFFIEPEDDPSGNEPLGDNAAQVFVIQGVLTVQSAASEHIALYNAAGMLLMQQRKDVGVATYNVSHLPQGVYFIKGDSGWTKKIIVR